MHDHDLDLIAEHASGLLDGADASRASQLIDTCVDCAREYRDQRAIRVLLAEAPVPEMSEFERQRLRRAVLDTAAPAPVVRGWQRRFLPVMGVAAAMLVTVVGVGVVGSMGGQDESVTLADGGADTTQSAEALVAPADEPTFGIAADSALEDSVEESEEADAGGESAVQSARSTGLLIDATGSDLDSVLAEVTLVVAESIEPVILDDAVAFGLTCAPLIEEPILAGILAEIDGAPTQVFLSGDRAEPTLTYLRSPECTP